MVAWPDGELVANPTPCVDTRAEGAPMGRSFKGIGTRDEVFPCRASDATVPSSRGAYDTLPHSTGRGDLRAAPRVQSWMVG